MIICITKVHSDEKGGQVAETPIGTCSDKAGGLRTKLWGMEGFVCGFPGMAEVILNIQRVGVI